MRLLTSTDIVGMINNPDGQLRIANFSPNHLQHAAYYVTLGDRFWRPVDSITVVQEDTLSAQNRFLGFKPGEFLHAESRELFKLGPTVFGIIGGVTDSYKRSILLVGGQFVDPLFPGEEHEAPLQFGLKNMSTNSAAIGRGDVIAKICFFDVSDSSPIELIRGSIAEEKFQEARIRALDAQLTLMEKEHEVSDE